MKYKNATEVLPDDLIEAIQKYVQGEYVYIPIKKGDSNRSLTDYGLEVQKRNGHIYTKHLEGMKNVELATKYSLSESSIRRIIIDQRKRYKEMKNHIITILDYWNIEDVELKQIYDSAWQVGDNYVLKVYSNAAMLERNVRIISILSNLEIPVGHLIPNRDNLIYSKDEHNYYILTERLKGKNIVSIGDSDEIGLKMGRIIADLHRAFLQCEQQDNFWENSLLSEMKGWITDTFEKKGWPLIDRNLFEVTVQQLERRYDQLPVQLIHRDVHFGNFIFNEGVFSGYIDFDLSQRNIRIFDLCYFVLGLLSEEETLDITEEKWFEILRDVFRGYNEVNELSSQEIEAVPCVMQSIELLFAAWFLRQEDKRCSENAVAIFNFVSANEKKISDILRNKGK